MKNSSNMVWVFSFADLAFLLVMVLALMPKADADFSSVKLSKVNSVKSAEQESIAVNPYRIYVSSGNDSIKSIHIQKRDHNESWKDIKEFENIEQIKNALTNIKNEKADFNFLADKDSNTGTLLQTLALLQEIWPKKEIHTTVKLDSNAKK
jgi:biopolymer transport protein ExbD